jgi:uncharacterized protein YqgV (UPF0045/DUF77 family)
MKTAIEISLYPLQDNYIEIIKWFIHRFDGYPNVERLTNGMSTQLQGPHEEIMALLSTEMKAAYQQWGRSVFVCKFIPGGVNLTHTE